MALNLLVISLRTMLERFLRIEALRLPTADIAQLLEISEPVLARWITGELPNEDADVIEVGLSMLEYRRPA